MIELWENIFANAFVYVWASSSGRETWLTSGLLTNIVIFEYNWNPQTYKSIYFLAGSVARMVENTHMKSYLKFSHKHGYQVSMIIDMVSLHWEPQPDS